MVTRFAPSPTGALHLGHAAAAASAFDAARDGGGRFLLRIEDIDAARCRTAFVEGIEADLRWLGLPWDGAMRMQSRHMDDYAAALAVLEGEGLLYPCFCTRGDIAREVAASGHAPHGPDGAALYPGTCRALDAAERRARMAGGQPYARRLDMAEAVRRAGALSWWERGEGLVAARPEAWGDVVLGRKDVPASYHLCVTHDDALQGVTLVTRGRDLRDATSVHRVLQALLGWPAPEYRHHALLCGPDGRRLAKRDGAATLAAMRDSGVTAAEVLRLVRAGPA